MVCPECGGSVRVVDTIPNADTEIFRRRKCRDCQFTFRTVEILDDGSAEFKRNYNEATLKKSDLFREVREAKPVRKEENSVNCPKCKSGRGYIRGSVVDRHNVTHRRRVCNVCGHTFYSMESEVASGDEFHKAWNRQRAMNKLYKGT